MDKCASKGPLLFLIFLPLLQACAGNPFHVFQYGDPVAYGEGRHPGIDYPIPYGTPIIAVSDGVVDATGEWNINIKGQWANFRFERKGSRGSVSGKLASDTDGYGLSIWHGDDFASGYGHLSAFFVDDGQRVNRGDIIGLSGAAWEGTQKIHFVIGHRGWNWLLLSNTYDPKGYWLGGSPRCFDPKEDYSKYSSKEMTHPVACGDHAKELGSKTRKRD